LELGTHTDSAEEAVLVEDDTIEVTIGNEKEQPSGEVGVVHVMEPHNFCNISSNKPRVIILYMPILLYDDSRGWS
jgi:hypothetical protein